MNTTDLSEKKSEIASTMQALLEARGLLEQWAVGSICCGSPAKIKPVITKLDQAFDFLSTQI